MYSLDVLYQFNNKYAPYAGVSMMSLFESNRHFDKLTVHVFDDCSDPITDENRALFAELAKIYGRTIKVYDTSHLVQLMKDEKIPTYRGSYAANMRMFFSRVLNESISRLLYMDSDTLIVNKLDELVTIDLQDNYVGMIRDSVGNSHKKDIGLGDADDYYNSGVILFDVKKWENESCEQKILDHVRNRRANYPAPDQDLLNVVLHGNIKTLNLKYNFQPHHSRFDASLFMNVFKCNPYYSINEIKAAALSPIILHCFRFIGTFPWHANNIHPYTSLWDEYLERSPWKNYQKCPAKLGIANKIQIVLYRYFPAVFYLWIFSKVHKLYLKQANKASLEAEKMGGK